MPPKGMGPSALPGRDGGWLYLSIGPSGEVSVKHEVCEFRWLRIPYERVRTLLLTGAVDLLEPAASAGLAHSREVLTTLDAEVAGLHLEREVSISLGGFLDIGDPLPILKMPLQWHAANHPELYPVMDGTLEAYPISGDRTQLSIQGHYRPPFGRLGTAIDKLILHRIAEAAVEHFLDQIAERIHAEVNGATVDTEELPLIEPEHGVT